MPDYTLPNYDKPRDWIKASRDRGYEWDTIMLARKNDDAALEQFLMNQEDMNFWPALSIKDWKTIVSLQKIAEENSKNLSFKKGFALIHNKSEVNAVTIPEDQFSSWQLYKNKLLSNGFKEETVDEIESTTLKILKRLNNDTTVTGPVKGLVIGNVQSGKTANMAALMAMAADWGWNMFIVLSGTIENLRIQTQNRLFNDLNQQGTIFWRSLEHLSKSVDISQRAQSLHFDSASKERYFTVCLKNSSRLSKLIQWAQADSHKQTIAVQRWYAPRLNNKYYNLGAFLRMKINDKGLGLDTMEPVFKVIQALYNRANYVKEEDIFVNYDIEVKIESVNLRGCLNETSSGKVAFAKVPRKVLGMEAPLNKPEPFMYLNCEIRDEDVNRPIVCFVRKPAMIVSYENVGAWVSNIPTTSKDEYIIAIYVLNSSNSLKSCPTAKSLEEYVRRSEMADHTSWEDWSEGNYNPRIITKIQNGVNKLISKEFVTEIQTVKPKINSGLGKMFGDMLLPPDGFGKRPSPGHNPSQGQNSSGRKGFHFRVEDEKIKYLSTGMIVPLILETSGKNKIIGTAFQIQVDSESKKIEIVEWETKMGLVIPFDIQDVRIEVIMIDGQMVNKKEILSSDKEKINISDISFSKLKSSKGTCYGLHIFSDNPRAMKIRMNITIKINRKDVKPVFVFEKEETNE